MNGVAQRGRKRVDHAVVVEVQQQAEKDRTAGGDHHAASAVEKNTPVDDREDIEKGEDAFYPPGRVDDGRDEEGVHEKLGIGQLDEVSLVFEKDDVDEGQKIDCGDEHNDMLKPAAIFEKIKSRINDILNL